MTPYAGLIESDNQILGEALDIAGTPYSLNYRSDRVPGRTAPYTVTIPLTGPSVPANLTQVNASIDIAGQQNARSFAAGPSLSYDFPWNGLDGFGRALAGATAYTVKLDYLGTAGAVESLRFSGNVGSFDPRGALGLGGWTVSAQHFLDVPHGTLYYGDGGRRSLESEANQLFSTGDVYERNGFGEVTHYQAGFDDHNCTPSGPPSIGCLTVLDQTFTRDAAGRITRKSETLLDPIAGDIETHVYDYTYDLAGRLTTVERDGVAWEIYTYDANGNRISWTDPWGSGTATYDAQDRLLTYGSYSYTYTANGELRTKSQGDATVTYAYDVLGNLRGVTLADGIQIDYVIDALNRRTGKKVNGVLVQGFLYGGGAQPLAELDGTGRIVSSFVYGSHASVPDALVRDGVTYRVVTDHIGSVRWVLNAKTGEVMQRLDYDAFGRVLLDTNPGFQPFGFAGGLYDYQTELVRFGARDYDGEAGRWTAKDPIGFAGSEANLYDYALADPIDAVDYDGRETGYITNYTSGQSSVPFTRQEAYQPVVQVVAEHPGRLRQSRESRRAPTWRWARRAAGRAACGSRRAIWRAARVTRSTSG